jgi:anti-sigma factor RsiW
MGISCEEVWRDLSDYIDGELNPAQRGLLDQHFSECRRCVAVLDGSRNVIRLYRDERLLQVPQDLDALLQKTLQQHSVTSRRSFLAWGLSAAATIPLGFALYSLFPRLKRTHSLPHRDAPPVSGLVAVSQDEKIKVYHRAGCPKLLGEPKFLPVEEAIRNGYQPCPVCIAKTRQGKTG